MRQRLPKDYLVYFAPAIVITLAGFVIAYQFVDPAPPRHITIAAGRSNGAYYDVARRYADILARDGVTMRVTETAGSVENLSLIADKDSGIDVILLQGGVGTPTASDDLVSLGSLFYEPLWVFHRAELSVTHLYDLKGKRIAAGDEGSGTKNLALRLLTLNDVTTENTQIVHVRDEEAGRRLMAGDIDAALFVLAYHRKVRLDLMDSPHIRLMSFRRGPAYTKRLHYLSLMTLPEGVFDFANNSPESEIDLLAPTAQLVVRDDFHPALVDLLLEAAKEVGSPGGIFERQGDFPTPAFVYYPLSSEAERYYTHGQPFLQRHLPFWLVNLIARMKIMLLPLIALLFPLIKLLPPFYRWRVRSRIYRWYDQLMEIDYEMLNGSIGQRRDEFLKRLETIEKNVSQISVPLGFTRELYDMRVHIELLREKLLTERPDATNRPV